MGVRPSGMHVNKPVVFGILAVIIAFMFIYKMWIGSGSVSFSSMSFGLTGSSDLAVVTVDESGKATMDVATLPPAPFLDPAVEATMMTDAKTIDVAVGATTLHVFRQQVSPLDGNPKLDILLLHGAAFTSANWTSIKTLVNLASWGYRATAIDMPGRGQSPGVLSRADIGQFVGAFVLMAGLTNLVVVAPSASGAAALPFLFDFPDQSTTKAKGFVPIAPVFTDQYGAQYPKSQLPTLIVYGTMDPNGPSTATNLQLLPKSVTAPIPEAGHPCYLEKPQEFHTLLYHWLKTLS